jgi:hypothetical protein
MSETQTFCKEEIDIKTEIEFSSCFMLKRMKSRIPGKYALLYELG